MSSPAGSSSPASSPPEPSPEESRPFVVPCAVLDAGAPLRWLRAGWRDLDGGAP